MRHVRAAVSFGDLLRRPVSRHNLNMTAAQRRLVAAHLAGRRAPTGGRERFERALARYLGVPHVLTVASGRQALALALRALRLPPGARVGLPRYCFYSLIGVVEALGLRPVFLPVDPQTLALDAEALDAATGGLDGLIFVHPFGQLGPVTEIAARCRRAGIPWVEDASQSTGASLDGRQAGSFGDVGVLSLVSGKNLQTFGGGVVATADAALGARLDPLYDGTIPADAAATRANFKSGLVRWSLSTRPGFTALAFPAFLALSELSRGRYTSLMQEERVPFSADGIVRRLSDAQGEYGCLDLEQLDPRNETRRRNALQLLGGLAGVDGIQVQRFSERAVNTFNAVPVRVTDGPGFVRGLLRRGVDTRFDYMEWFGGSRDFDEDVVYLPNHPALTSRDADRVGVAAREVLEAQGIRPVGFSRP
jgi:dTDP-4-amino-4,6-dideoxygalactose transaminase